MGMSISGLSAPTPSINPAAQLAGLEAQIAQYQKQLADCVNCDTATTLTGQSAIEELSAKINVTKERLEAIAAVKSGDGTAKASDGTVAAIKPVAGQSGGTDGTGSLTASQAEARRLAPTGALLDKFA